MLIYTVWPRVASSAFPGARNPRLLLFRFVDSSRGCPEVQMRVGREKGRGGVAPPQPHSQMAKKYLNFRAEFRDYIIRLDRLHRILKICSSSSGGTRVRARQRAGLTSIIGFFTTARGSDIYYRIFLFVPRGSNFYSAFQKLLFLCAFQAVNHCFRFCFW